MGNSPAAKPLNLFSFRVREVQIIPLILQQLAYWKYIQTCFFFSLGWLIVQCLGSIKYLSVLGQQI